MNDLLGLILAETLAGVVQDNRNLVKAYSDSLLAGFETVLESDEEVDEIEATLKSWQDECKSLVSQNIALNQENAKLQEDVARFEEKLVRIDRICQEHLSEPIYRLKEVFTGLFPTPSQMVSTNG